MLQTGTMVNVIDNSGAKKGQCIKVMGHCKKRYASVGDLLLLSVKKLRNKRKLESKVKKGLMYKGLLVNTKSKTSLFSGESIRSLKNNVILLTKQGKPLGTRISCYLPLKLRYIGFLRVLSMSSGIIH